MAQTSMYIPDDLYEDLKAKGAPISRIARQALEEWLQQNADEPDVTTALRMIDSGTQLLKLQMKKIGVVTEPEVEKVKYVRKSRAKKAS